VDEKPGKGGAGRPMAPNAEKDVYCTSCGKKAALDNRFCTACGASLKEGRSEDRHGTSIQRGEHEKQQEG
jgi:hypothetical protein